MLLPQLLLQVIAAMPVRQRANNIVEHARLREKKYPALDAGGMGKSLDAHIQLVRIFRRTQLRRFSGGGNLRLTSVAASPL